MTITVATDAPRKPSQVLLGLMAGAIGERPNRLPTKNAATSLATVAMMASSRNATPWRWGNFSSSAANEPRKPTQAKARMVTERFGTGRARMTPIRYQRKPNTTNMASTRGNAASPFR